MRVETTQYEWSHGKRPRGFGFWMIKVGEENKEYPHSTFSQAVKEAKRLAKEKGLYSIEILP